MTESIPASVVLNAIQQLGNTVVELFDHSNSGFMHFPELAFEALSQCLLPPLQPCYLLEWLSSTALPAQRTGDVFSDLPLVLFQHWA